MLQYEIVKMKMACNRYKDDKNFHGLQMTLNLDFGGHTKSLNQSFIMKYLNVNWYEAVRNYHILHDSKPRL